MSASARVHLSLTVFDGGRVVLRDHLVHSSSLNAWAPLGAPARPRAPLPPPGRVTASLSVYAGGEHRATVSAFLASTSAVGGLELRHGDSDVCVNILARHRDPEQYEAYVRASVDDAFLNTLLFRDEYGVNFKR